MGQSPIESQGGTEEQPAITQSTAALRVHAPSGQCGAGAKGSSTAELCQPHSVPLTSSSTAIDCSAAGTALLLGVLAPTPPPRSHGCWELLPSSRKNQ